MELPELGTHCAVSTCKRLDFLPFECDACLGVFCLEHKTYEQHNCHNAYTKDVQVPVCPLCNQPVPISRGDDPNTKVDEHIRNDCQSDKAKKLYTNRCSFPSCKKKELVPVQCNTCQKNFCLKHRFETNHDCQGHPNRLGGASNSRSRPAARGGPSSSRSSTQTKHNPHSTTLTQIGAELHRERMQRQQQTSHPSHHTRMSEDEALALAIAASMSDHAPNTTPSQPEKPQQAHTTDEDEALARAIAASLNDTSKPPQGARSTSQSQRSGQHRKQEDSSGCQIA